ncbi:hypothetical protein ILYODFUR_007681 [Ilyodon furcidens]|uniref:Secreted protein n=1 Tax=Ilyodon furcidens TaxID=33524 RepID=A0ABV0TST0_9TELE
MFHLKQVMILTAPTALPLSSDKMAMLCATALHRGCKSTLGIGSIHGGTFPHTVFGPYSKMRCQRHRPIVICISCVFTRLLKRFPNLTCGSLQLLQGYHAPLHCFEQ